MKKETPVFFRYYVLTYSKKTPIAGGKRRHHFIRIQRPLIYKYMEIFSPIHQLVYEVMAKKNIYELYSDSYRVVIGKFC